MNRATTFSIFLFCVLLSSSAIAQEKEYKRFETREIDTNYIKDYSSKILFKLYGITKSNSITRLDELTEHSIEYKPNEDFNIGFGIGYRWFGLDLAFNISESNNDQDIFGETKRLDFQGSLYLRKLICDFHLQTYEGYYLSNAASLFDDFDPENPVYPIRPDINSINVTASAFYIFKHDRYSIRSAFIYNERQMKSAGSFIVGPYFNYFKMNADSSLIPSKLAEEFNQDIDFRGTSFTSFGLSGGYGFNLVIFKRVYLSFSMALGLGPENKKSPATEMSPASEITEMGSRLAIRGGMGFNSEKYFFGFSGVSLQSAGDDKVTLIERSVSNFKIFVGRRFNPPGFLTGKKKKS